ncbi:MAG: acyl-CoA dehydrogenase [Alphaproteobacteria bacterium]|nr:acyl-CoA dehydrogenase [Alphaproteobacteria bacterium]
MWHELTSDQQLLRDTTARYLADHVPLDRQRKERDHPAGFEPSYWTGGAELGWIMPLVSEDMGGGSVSGRGVVDLSLIAYEFGRHSAPGPLVDCNVVAGALQDFGNDHAEALEAIMAGSAIAPVCLGAAPWQQPGEASVSISREGDDVVIEGKAKPVESAGQASWFLVTGRSQGGMTQALVPTSAAGVSVKNLKAIDISRKFGAVTFDRVRLPASSLVGEFGQALEQATQQVRNACVMLCAESVGAMESAFAMTVDWAFERYTFGRALASYQALKHRFADMKAWLEASHAICDAAADALADGTSRAAETVSSAKAYVGEQGVELAQDCVQIHGGIGVTYEHDLHFFLRRVTLNRLLYGTPGDHRRWLAALQIEKELAA